jgi:putative sterol carrier protein
MATLEELTDRVRQAVAAGDDLGKSITLNLKGEGFIHVAGTEVQNENKPADLTVTISRKDLVAMGKGELDPMRAMMTGRLRLSDMGLALSLQPKIQALFAKLA